jgi:hypothetical protein
MEKRSYYRTPVRSGFSTELLLDGRIYSGIPVTNIGLRGCCVRLPVTSAPHLKDHALIDNLLLSGAQDEYYPLKGRIAWHDQADAGRDRWIKAGVEFLETPEACAREIRELLAEDLSDWDH